MKITIWYELMWKIRRLHHRGYSVEEISVIVGLSEDIVRGVIK